MRSRRRWSVATTLLAIALTGCGADGRDTLVVRTDLPRELRTHVERSFESAVPDVNLRFTTGTVESTRAELSDPAGPPFDVWWGAPALDLARAAEAGEIEPKWVAWAVTPFVIAFDQNQVPLARAPIDWIDLFHHRWADGVAVLDPSRTEEGAWFVGAAMVEALREHGDPTPGVDWLRRLEPQVRLAAGSAEEVLRAVRSGAVVLAVLPRATVEQARAEGAGTLYYRIPESGSPTLVHGVGVVRGSDAPEAARAFIEHLATADIATESKRWTRWEPLLAEPDAGALPDGFELPYSWTPRDMAVDTIARNLPAWLDRWEREVRGR